MENSIELAIAAVAGVVIGYLLGGLGKTKAANSKSDAGGVDHAYWWETRKTLTGTQLQILQHMESVKEASIGSLQEKFSFIPDRELYYRLEQIVLLKFLARGRQEGDVVYILDADYSSTVEEDKTVMLST
jgi:hypothetical protein